MSKTHSVKLYSESDDGPWWMVICPFDLANDDRPCVVVDCPVCVEDSCTACITEKHEGARIIPGQCNYREWADNAGCVLMCEVEFPVDAIWTGDGYQFVQASAS